MGPRATLRTVARHLGLSITTVSRALKDGDDVHPDTIMRVKEAASALGYAPGLHGLRLRTGRSWTIYAVCGLQPVEDVPDGHAHAMLEAMREVLAETPYTLAVWPVRPGDDDLDAVRRIVAEGRADGVILDHTRPDDPRVRLLLEADLPFVTYGRTDLDTHAWVDPDNEAAAAMATEHLIRHGHRRIALIDPPLDYTFSRQRGRGYGRALRAAGLRLDPSLVTNTALGASHSRAAARELCALRDAPTAFVCSHMPATLGTIAGLRDAGRVIGRDAVVVSRDGSNLSGYLNPPLTTCFVSMARTSIKLCELLLRVMDGEPVANLQELLPVELVVHSDDRLRPQSQPLIAATMAEVDSR